MTRDQFEQLLRREYDEILSINQTKGHDYAGDEDALANFKRNAARLGLTAEQVWAVYHGKHQDAIDTFVREGDVKSEPIEGRIRDAILYLFLLMGLIEEARERVEVDDDDRALSDVIARAIPVRRVDHGDAS